MARGTSVMSNLVFGDDDRLGFRDFLDDL